MNEIWKSVVGYEGNYEVSNFGNVKSVDRYVTGINNGSYFFKAKRLKPAKSRDGYMQVGLSLNSKSCSYTVHSLVAKSFIPNPENKATVNHKDGNKLNNNVSNLEWATKSEQTIHALNNGLRVMPNAWEGKFGSKHGASKRVNQYDANGVFIREYGSIIEASNLCNIDAGGITGVCKGRHKTSGGFIWKYSNNCNF